MTFETIFPTNRTKFLNLMTTNENKEEIKTNIWSKNILQEFVQQKFGKNSQLPEYISEKSKDNMFKCKVKVENIEFQGLVWRKKKKDAEFDAAEEALKGLNITVKNNNLINKNIETIEKFYKNYDYLVNEILKIKDSKELKRALTFSFLHSSFLIDNNVKKFIKEELKLNEISEIEDYNRYEFLGDSFIELNVSNYLFNNKNIFSAGEMTKRRSELVNRKRLNEIMIKNETCKYILFSGNDVLETSIPGDVLEAVIGAVYSINGYDDALKVLVDVYKVI
jgi:dsRNA-specific ribonuclease